MKKKKLLTTRNATVVGAFVFATAGAIYGNGPPLQNDFRTLNVISQSLLGEITGTEVRVMSQSPDGDKARTAWHQWLVATLPAALRRQAQMEWLRIAAGTPSLPVPESVLTSNGSVLLVWSYRDFHAELELYGDGTAQWLITARDDEVVSASGDERYSPIPTEFYSAMRSGADAWRTGA